MAIYMQLSGARGDVGTKGYENWIQLLSLDASINRGVKNPVGKPRDRTTTNPSFSAFEITKKVDKSSSCLIRSICDANNIPKVLINICTTGVENIPYVKYELNDVLLSHYSCSVLGESDLIETMHLHFAKIQKTYIPRDGNNQAQSPIICGYDLETAQSL